MNSSKQSKRCLHCSEPADASDFCCSGCQVAYQMIHAAGLEAVYGSLERKWAKPQSQDSARFAVFDHQDYLNQRAPLASDGTREIELPLTGMMCSACVWVVEHLNHFVPAIEDSRVDFGRERVRFRFRDGTNVLREAAETLGKLGYRLHPEETLHSSSPIHAIEWIRLGVAGLSAAGTMHVGLVLIGAHETGMDTTNARWLGFTAGLLSLPALTFGAWPFFRSAFHHIRLKHLSADLLVCIAILIGGIYSLLNAVSGEIESYFDALSMVVFLLLGGRILVRSSTRRVATRPLWFARKNNAVIPAQTLKVSDTYEVLTSEVVPTDAKLISSDGFFDQSALTGEAKPVRLVSGQSIHQGVIALGPVTLEATRTADDSYLEILAQKVKVAEWHGLPPRYETSFTTLILLLALATLAFANDREVSKAIAILIVTCPCALQLAHPLGLLQLKMNAGRRGMVLFQTERSLQLAGVKDVFFDKTGTLTQGSPQLEKYYFNSTSEHSEDELRHLVFQLAKNSEHPLSKSIAQKFSSATEVFAAPSEIQDIPGKGVFAKYQNLEVSLAKASAATADQHLSKTVSSLRIENQELASFYFSDLPRADASQAIRTLQAKKIRVHLLSGDHQQECERLAKVLGVHFESVLGDCSPERKEEVLKRYPHSALVGDGLNDALAMRAAATGIGFSGSAESNVKAADVYLLRRDLAALSELIELAGFSKKTLRLNLQLSFLYNFVSIGLVFAGVVGPILCAIFMPISSLTVILLASRSGRPGAEASFRDSPFRK